MVGPLIMEDQPTVHKTRLAYARVLLIPHDPVNLAFEVRIKTPRGLIAQKVVFE